MVFVQNINLWCNSRFRMAEHFCLNKKALQEQNYGHSFNQLALLHKIDQSNVRYVTFSLLEQVLTRKLFVERQLVTKYFWTEFPEKSDPTKKCCTEQNFRSSCKLMQSDQLYGSLATQKLPCEYAMKADLSLFCACTCLDGFPSLDSLILTWVCAS